VKRGIIAWTAFFALGLGVGCSDTTNTFGSSAGAGGGGGGAGTVKIALMSNATLGIYNGIALGTQAAGVMQATPAGVADPLPAGGVQPNSLDLPFHIVLGLPPIFPLLPSPPGFAGTPNLSPTANSYGIFVDPNFAAPVPPKTAFPTYGQMKTWTLHYDIATTIPVADINSIAITWGPTGYPGTSTTIWPQDLATNSLSWSSLNAAVPAGTFVSCKAVPSSFTGGISPPPPDNEPVNQLFEIVASMRGPLQANGEIYLDNIYWSTN
jgi:hypothetical protein